MLLVISKNITKVFPLNILEQANKEGFYFVPSPFQYQGRRFNSPKEISLYKVKSLGSSSPVLSTLPDSGCPRP